jgi:hypothetical protein
MIMAWNDLTFDFGSILSKTQMDQLFDDFEALAQGQDGAPAILNAALNSWPWGVNDIQNYCIRRAKINTTTVSHSGTLAASDSVNITLPSYCFWPAISQTAGIGGPILIQAFVGTADALNPKFKLTNSSPDYSCNYTVAGLYVIA